ncbi:hypothetical protein QYF61_003100 [Mycteria americana]|uniref:Uncharacterized protein n=1 Tax=Mycteria americana TaxID=33587 RepID=A0AAN7NK27_MYCAM|nr:hypothetical protein QYF61_003100 [Mycteria americana]
MVGPDDLKVTTCEFKREAGVGEFQDAECSKHDIRFNNIAPKLSCKDAISHESEELSPALPPQRGCSV